MVIKGTPNDNARIAVLCPPWLTTKDAPFSTMSWSSQAWIDAFGGTRNADASMLGPTVTIASTGNGSTASRMCLSIRRCPAYAHVLRLINIFGVGAARSSSGHSLPHHADVVHRWRAFHGIEIGSRAHDLQNIVAFRIDRCDTA